MKWRMLTPMIASAAAALAEPLSAAAADVVFAQPSSALGTLREAETNSVICLAGADISRFRIRMDVNGTEHNCAVLEFGVDADASGTLERGEVEFSAGWDCGEWVCRDRRTGAVGSSPRAPGSHSLDILVCLRGDGVPYAARVNDGDGTFQDVAPGSMFSRSWNLARLVTRGAAPLQSARVRCFAVPFRITIR